MSETNETHTTHESGKDGLEALVNCEFCGRDYDSLEEMRNKWHEVGYCLISTQKQAGKE